MSHQIKNRDCGACNFCCIHLEIESRPGYSTRLDDGDDIAKAKGEPCRYLGEKGCTIYDARPLVCRSFQCDWQLGAKGFGPKDSPLLTGIMGVRGEIWTIEERPALKRPA